MTLYRFVSKALMAVIFTAALGYAQEALAEKKKYKLGAKVRLQSIHEENRDLATRNTETATSFAFDFQPELKLYLTKDTTAYIEARAVKIFGDDGVQDDDGQISAADQFAELRELWLNHEINDNLDLKIGRQRIREERNLFWSDDVDAITLNYDGETFGGMLGLVHNFMSYRTSEEDFLERDEERLRALAEGSWEYTPDHRIELRSLYEHDHSDQEQLGQLVVSDNRDDFDYDLLWLGTRAKGEFKTEGETIKGVKYRADLAMVTGEETLVDTASTADPDFRIVTGQRQRDVLGWAVDAGVDIAFAAPADFILTLNYAYGSGDDDPTDGTDNAFKDTDIKSNTSRFGAVSSTIHNYGEAFRPELENLHIFSAGIGVPAFKKGDVSLIYHRYIQDEKGTSLGSNRLLASVNNMDRDVGQEIDMALNMDLHKQFENTLKIPKKTRLRLSSGVFLPGDAYNAIGVNDDPVWRLLMDLSFKF